MESKKNYSVLMSVYYKEKPEYLEESIDSIINQSTKTNDFVIVCDGELTKELYTVLEEKKKKFEDINILQLDHNYGLGIALNKGLEICKNNLVARMDSDDISELNRCEEELNKFLEDDKLSIIGSDIIEFSDENTQSNHKTVPHSYEEILRYSKKRNPFNHMTVMFKKNVVQSAGGYQDMPFVEDYYLWARILKNGNYAENIDKPLVRARTGIGMINRRGGLNYAKCIVHFRYTLYKIGYTNFVAFLFNTIPHVLIALIPSSFRKKIYYILLRGKR